MLKAHRLTPDHLQSLSALYADFLAVAKDKYRWAYEPIPLDLLQKAIEAKQIDGYWLADNVLKTPVALMLFTREDHRAIEINAIHMASSSDDEPPNRKTILDTLMRAFLSDLKSDEAGLASFDVISYPMLGEQELFIDSILWYGFRAVGQAIVRFDIMDPVSLTILQQQNFGPLPEGYRLSHWEPHYAGGVAQVIYESFCKTSDSYWDPRFRSESGAKKVVGMLSYDLMGTLRTESTSVLLKDDTPVGVCYLIQSSMTEGNIPLVGVLPSEKKKGFGNQLLKHTLDAVVKNILDGHIGMLSIHATHDTDNIASIKMYRKLGFREEYNYPHVYLSTDKLKTLQMGKWC